MTTTGDLYRTKREQARPAQPAPGRKVWAGSVPDRLNRLTKAHNETVRNWRERFQYDEETMVSLYAALGQHESALLRLMDRVDELERHAHASERWSLILEAVLIAAGIATEDDIRALAEDYTARRRHCERHRYGSWEPWQLWERLISVDDLDEPWQDPEARS